MIDSIYKCSVYVYDEIIRNGSFELLEGESEQDNLDAFNKIHKEIERRLGVSPDFRKSIRLELEILKYRLSILKGKKSDMNFLRKAREDLEAIHRKAGNASFRKGLIEVCRREKYHISAKDISVGEYLDYLESYKE